MSYENSPDYGSKKPTLGEVLLIVFLVVAAVAAALGWLAIAG